MPRSSQNRLSNSSPKLPVQHNNQLQQHHQPSLVSNIIQGFGLGVGQSIANNIFRSDPVVKHIYETPPNNNSKEYIQCMKESNNDKEACKEYLEQ